MSKEIPPLHRPTDLPPPKLRKIVKVGHDGMVKEREVWDYCDEDVKRQRYALDLMRKAHVSSRYSVGGQPGRRLMYNVWPHIKAMRRGVGERAFYLLDFKSAFPNVDQNEARLGVFSSRAFDNRSLFDAAEQEFLEQYLHDDIGAFLTVGGERQAGVPQGNATSGIMLDAMLRRTEYRIGNWLTTGVYTRWIDDLTFSAPASKKTGKFPDSNRRTIRTMLKDNPGVVLNDKKTQSLTSRMPVTITGITFNQSGYVAPSDEILLHARECFDGVSALLDGGEITERDVNVFDGYRGALGLAGRPEKSQSIEVRSLYNRSIKLGNALYMLAAKQGVIKPRPPLVHSAATRNMSV